MRELAVTRALIHDIFTEVLRRRNNAYVAHSIVKCTVPNIPLDFMKRFMAEVAGKGRLESAKAWDKEGPRVLTKNFRDNKAWSFYLSIFLSIYLSISVVVVVAATATAASVASAAAAAVFCCCHC